MSVIPFWGPAPIRQPIHIPVTFTVFGTPTDPTTVLFSWDMPNAIVPASLAVTTWSGGSGGSSSGGPPAIVRDGVGLYHVEVEPLSGPGPLRWRWEGTGTCQSVVEGQLDVAASPLA